jgi:uncharacterized membrane protein
MITNEVLLELENYASREGTELGELWFNLVDLWEGYRSYMDEKFLISLEEAILNGLQEAKEMEEDGYFDE